MTDALRPLIFGEVLFDCFADGQQVLGGAPFNVAWHLQAFADQPLFVSSIGADEPGQKVMAAMQEWHLDTGFLQTDPLHPTGRVEVTLKNNEPHYAITDNCAYDFISAEQIASGRIKDKTIGLVYHGTLALRNAGSRQALQALISQADFAQHVFLDVNLRVPWWQKTDVLNWLDNARWVKLNSDELQLLGPNSGDSEEDMARFQAEHDIELLIVTRGEQGATIRQQNGESLSIKPEPAKHFVDTVGAGDAFTAVIIHGLLQQWPLQQTLTQAQRFASAVVGIRGATTNDLAFYRSNML